MPKLSERGFVIDKAVFIPSIVFLLSSVLLVLALPEASDAAFADLQSPIAVSYTHLTLPTICSV